MSNNKVYVYLLHVYVRGKRNTRDIEKMLNKDKRVYDIVKLKYPTSIGTKGLKI